MRRSLMMLTLLLLGCSSRKETPQPESGPATTTAPTTSSSAVGTASFVERGPMPVRMIALQGGTFDMGTDGITHQNELDWCRPLHTAKVGPFQIDVTEVTVEAYRRCVDANVCSPPVQQKEEIDWPKCTWFEPDRKNHPVNCVTWAQADGYCRWAGKELPTEEMWEFAARGKTGRDFPWGDGVRGERWGAPHDILDRLMGSCQKPNRETEHDTCPVGSALLGATPEGVLDLAGNVREWTASMGCPYDKKMHCDREDHAIRGGTNNWYSRPYANLAYYRGAGEPDYVSQWLGFRCAKSGAP